VTVANELADSIERLSRFLRDHNESFWADKLDQDAVWIRRDDAYGLDRFLALFGGMGSLDDLVFHPENENYEEGEQVALNEELQALRLDALRLAEDARHDLR
jgi:hypothetical protein